MNFIEEVRIDNFKSLVDFSIKLGPFACLIGLNGAGKSTVLQALGFIGSFFKPMGVQSWLSQRNWEISDTATKLSSKKNLTVSVAMQIDGRRIVWKGSFNRVKVCCTTESLLDDESGSEIFSVSSGSMLAVHMTGPGTNQSGIWPIKYQGSLLSVVDAGDLAPVIQRARGLLAGLTALDLMIPQSLRASSRKAFASGRSPFRTTGTPSSAPSRMPCTRGICPRKGMSSLAAI